MNKIAVAAEITATGALTVLSIMALISLSIWLTGRAFVFAENRKQSRTAPARLEKHVPAQDAA